MLDGVCKVCMQANSTHLVSIPKMIGLILYATLQDLWVLKEFKVALIGNHNLIWPSMVSHLFPTYILRSELDLMKLSTLSTKTKCSKPDRLVAVHKKITDATLTAAGNLKKEIKDRAQGG